MNHGKKRARQDEQGHAIRVAQQVKGLLLAHAFMVVKVAGLSINVSKLDGLPRTAYVHDSARTINVDVVDGAVKNSWVHREDSHV